MTTTAVKPLSSAQVAILQTLAKNPGGLNREQLAKKAGVPVMSGNVGPVFPDVLPNYPDSLVAQKMVSVDKAEDGEYTFRVTAKGVKAAAVYKTRRRTRGGGVPAELVDKVVIAFRPTRTYGLELYTDADITEIRDKLGSDYASVKVDDLRQIIVSRRKQGAFSDPAEKRTRAIRRVLSEFGPGGTVEEILTVAQVKQLRGLLD